MGEQNPDRRSVLKAIGAAGTSSVAIGGVAGATGDDRHSEESIDRLREVKQRYQNQSQIRQAVALHATDLLKELNERNLLPHQSVQELDVGKPLTKNEFHDVQEGVNVLGLFQDLEETPTAHILVRRQHNDNNVLIVVRPEAEEAYAVINNGSDSQRYILSSDSTTDSVYTASPCYTNGVCIVTENWCTELHTYCCDGYCYTGETTGDTCVYEQCCYSHCCQACSQCSCDGSCCRG